MAIAGLAMSLTVWCSDVTRFLSCGEAVKELVSRQVWFT